MTSISIFLLRVSAFLYASSLVHGSIFPPFEYNFELDYYYGVEDIETGRLTESSTTRSNESSPMSSNFITPSTSDGSWHLKEYPDLDSVYETSNGDYFLLDLNTPPSKIVTEEHASLPSNYVLKPKPKASDCVEQGKMNDEYILVGNEILLRSSIDESLIKKPGQNGWFTTITSRLSPKTIIEFLSSIKAAAVEFDESDGDDVECSFPCHYNFEMFYDD